MASWEEESLERRPLLAPSAPPGAGGPPRQPEGNPPPYSAVPDISFNRPLGPNEVLYESGEDELPPAYTPSIHGTVPTINCRVCGALISLSGRLHLHIVKCDQCQEATPLKPAPPGKKYVRCQCHCLLICKVEAQRVACPRPDCKKVILFRAAAEGVNDASNARVVCIHCQQMFLFNLTNHALARCPHCRKISSIGRSYALNRARLFFIIALLILLIAIIVTALTHSDSRVHRGVIAAYVFLYALVAGFLLRSFYYFRIKPSLVEATVT